jgi:hypothetical protein
MVIVAPVVLEFYLDLPILKRKIENRRNNKNGRKNRREKTLYLWASNT